MVAADAGGGGGEGVDAEDGGDADEAEALAPGDVFGGVDGLSAADAEDGVAGW